MRTIIRPSENTHYTTDEKNFITDYIMLIVLF